MGGHRASLKVRRMAQLGKILPFMDMEPYNPQPANWCSRDVINPKRVFIATQLNSTQLNSTDPVEQRTASQLCFCL